MGEENGSHEDPDPTIDRTGSPFPDPEIEVPPVPTRVRYNRTKREQRDEQFKRAWDRLPNKAPADAELTWIETHEAMTRYDRLDDKSKAIPLTGEDILRPSQGRAPSKCAVGLLQHFLTKPHKFFEPVLAGKVRKASAENVVVKEASVDVVVDDISEIKEMLRSMRKQQ